MNLHGVEAEIRVYENGEVIFQEGETGDHLFVIVRGAVFILKEGPQFKSRLATCEEGDILGEMSIIDSHPRSASAVAHGDTELMAFDRETFRKEIQRHPEFGFEIFASLALKLRRANEELQSVRAAYMQRQAGDTQP